MLQSETCLKLLKTVEYPVSNHPKRQDLVVTYENRTTMGLRKGVHVTSVWKKGRELIVCCH